MQPRVCIHWRRCWVQPVWRRLLQWRERQRVHTLSWGHLQWDQGGDGVHGVSCGQVQYGWRQLVLTVHRKHDVCSWRSGVCVHPWLLRDLLQPLWRW